MSTRIRYTKSAGEDGFKTSTKVFENTTTGISYVVGVNETTNTYKITNASTSEEVVSETGFKTVRLVKKAARIALQNLGVVFSSESRIRTTATISGGSESVELETTTPISASAQT